MPQDTETLGNRTAAGALIPESSTLERGTSLGRYIVLHKVGEGGMGQVYAAYDPELDRRVAIKVMRFASDEPESFSSRLRQEGRALARLRHPNVVTVFDVGVSGDRLFIATELVDGVTVDCWLREQRPSWKAVLEAFIKIGSGIAAAHAEGLIHRDVKPNNMMVAEDGRALVVDFGIARDSDLSEGAVVGLDNLGRPELSTETEDLTGAAGVAGTPAFMAPEQRSGATVGPEADLYSFCLSLHYALFDELPQDPSTDGAKLEGSPFSTPTAAAGAAAVPMGLRRMVLSGLHEDPDRRPESMSAFVEDLRRFQKRGRRFRRHAAIGTIITLSAALVWLWQGPRPTVCTSAGDRFTKTWNPGRADALESLFVKSGKPFAADVWRTVKDSLERYGATWADQATEWCVAAHDGSLSSELLDLRMGCLEQRIRDVDATVGLLERDSGPLLSRAVDMVDGLPKVADCIDIRALRAPAPPPQDEAFLRRLATLRQHQAEARALWAAGELEAGLNASTALVADARELGHWPIIAEALFQQGLIQDARLEPIAAETLVNAALAAAASNHIRITAHSFIRLVRVAGTHLQNFDQARLHAQQATAALRALGHPGDLVANLEDQLGMNARHEGLYAESLAHLQKSLAWKVETLGADHYSVADTLLRLGNVYDDLNDHTVAEDYLNRALTLQLRHLGPSHPAVAETYARFGTIARERRNLDSALSYHQKAMEIHRKVHGPTSPLFAQSLTYLGELQALDGQFDAAETAFARALSILRETFDEDHFQIGVVYATMASAWTEAGRDEQAIAPYEKALAICEAAFGAEHTHVGVLRFNLATVYLRLHHFEKAATGFAEAIDIWQKSLGKNHALIANALTGQGDALERLGRAEEALPLLNRADHIDQALKEDDRRDPKDRADTAFAQARALLQLGVDHRRARARAEQAQGLYAKVPDASEREIRELNAWLAEHG